ncbi:hypothetical protein HBB16_08700 [Pseudonocardia sp. MCCB 268]|nr:hypothetical protein [Pseudonocardia cytotoxica]
MAPTARRGARLGRRQPTHPGPGGLGPGARLPTCPELADVIGQHDARRASEIAAAGGHHP